MLQECSDCLDSGSQRSYITEPLKTELSLQFKGEQRMNIMMFGSQEKMYGVCEVLNVSIVVQGG